MEISFNVGGKDYHIKLDDLPKKYELVEDSSLVDEVINTLEIETEEPNMDFSYDQIKELDNSAHYILYRNESHSRLFWRDILLTASVPSKKQAMKLFTEYIKDNYRLGENYCIIHVKTLEKTPINIEEITTINITY